MNFFDKITPFIFPIVVIYLIFKVLDHLGEIKKAAQGALCSNCKQRHHYSTYQCKKEQEELAAIEEKDSLQNSLRE